MDCLSKYPIQEEPDTVIEEESKLVVTVNLLENKKSYICEKQNEDPEIKIAKKTHANSKLVISQRTQKNKLPDH